MCLLLFVYAIVRLTRLVRFAQMHVFIYVGNVSESFLINHFCVLHLLASFRSFARASFPA
jgi:hypothetical protein